MTDFRALLKALVERHVKFIVIGGAAAIAHGSARLTQDLDVLYERSAENVERLVSALAFYKPYLRDVPQGLPFRWESETLLRGLNFTLTTTIGDVDLFGEIPGGGGYEQLAPAAAEISIFGSRCLCLSIPQLIRAKRAAGRPKDLQSIAELEAIAGETRS
jgi:predicted nucleotidyltransferase